MLPVRIIYGTKDGRLHLFCKLRIVFGEPIPAADLQIRDQSHKMAELRRMKNRLRDELEQLLADNAFAVRLAKRQRRNPLHRTISRSCRNIFPFEGEGDFSPLGRAPPEAVGGELPRPEASDKDTALSLRPAGPLLASAISPVPGSLSHEGGKDQKGAYLWRSSVPKLPASASVWTARCQLTYDLLAEGRKVATLGPLIHNAQVVADLEAKGRCDLPGY